MGHKDVHITTSGTGSKTSKAKTEVIGQWACVRETPLLLVEDRGIR